MSLYSSTVMEQVNLNVFSSLFFPCKLSSRVTAYAFRFTSTAGKREFMVPSFLFEIYDMRCDYRNIRKTNSSSIRNHCQMEHRTACYNNNYTKVFCERKRKVFYFDTFVVRPIRPFKNENEDKQSKVGPTKSLSTLK